MCDSHGLYRTALPSLENRTASRLGAKDENTIVTVPRLAKRSSQVNATTDASLLLRETSAEPKVCAGVLYSSPTAGETTAMISPKFYSTTGFLNAQMHPQSSNKRGSSQAEDVYSAVTAKAGR